MISNFFKRIVQSSKDLQIHRRIKGPGIFTIRQFFGLIPPSQYDMPRPKRLHLMYALRVYWEIIPLFCVTCTSLSICIYSIISACNNKVDVVFSARSRRNISRTMDLRYPTVHKIFLIKQHYEPWPEMQDVLDKMIAAEKRALVRMQSCSHA